MITGMPLFIVDYLQQNVLVGFNLRNQTSLVKML